MTGLGFTAPGFGLHALRGAQMEQNKTQPAPAAPAPAPAPAPAQAPATPKPAQAPVAAPKTQPAPAAPAPAAQGGLRLTDMGGPGLWNPSLTATQVNQNAGDPFAGSHTLGGMNPATISTIMNSPSAAPAAPSGGGFDPSKITRADMNKWRHITGARNMNSEMDKWKTYEAMNGRGRQATNAAFRRARAAGYR